MEENKEKRVLNIELSDEVKRVSITGKNGEEQVVMRQELNEDDLDQVAGGAKWPLFNSNIGKFGIPYGCSSYK